LFNPFVSIIIPVYNGSDFLSQAIDSALGQTYLNIEVIVIDDGSNDSGLTCAVAESYGDRIRFISKENGGVASALNEGIRQMKGEFFSWLSHDDLYEPGKVEAQVAYLGQSEDKNIVVYSDYTFVTAGRDLLELIRHEGFPPEESFFHMATTNSINGCTLLIPKKVFDEFGGFDETLTTTQDYSKWLQICQAYPFHHVGEQLLMSRVHDNQGSRTIGGHDEAVDAYFDKAFSLLMPDMLLALFESSTLAEKLDELLKRCALRGSIRDYIRTIRLTWGTLGRFSPGEYFYWYVLVKGVLLKKLPHQVIEFLLKARDQIRRLHGPAKLDFENIYRQNEWNGDESRSGRGSSLMQTETTREFLSPLLKELNIKSFLDLPCGDFAWMKSVDLSGVHYIGGDIVAPLVEKNQERYGAKDREFRMVDLLNDPLPDTDLLFCRDCLVHLSNEDIAKAVDNIKASNVTYLMTTTFPGRKNDELYGIWRPVDLEAVPFNFPKPLQLFNEKCTEEGGRYEDKSLGLWAVSSL